jgi:NAD(P)-dependent dehydrogenase (short-subunit alcohol dehydrogenase family)
MSVELAGQRVLVVGASSGIGRHIALEAAAAGATVAFAARRRDRLESAVKEAGGGEVVVGDVRKPEDCISILDDAVAAMGGVDLLVFATGITPLVRMEDIDAATLLDVFTTNTIGALTLITAAAGKVAPGGLIAYIGSDSVGSPYPGMVHYAASKAALDEGVDGLRREYPDVRFTRLAVGPTAGTEIALEYDPEVTARLLPEMLRFAAATERHMTAPDLGKLVVEMLAPALHHRDIEVEDIVIRPPGGPLPWGTDMNALMEVNKAFTDPDAGRA